jgi:hypothetical protein
MCVVDDDVQAQRACLLLVCVQVLHEKPILVAHWLACAAIHDDDDDDDDNDDATKHCRLSIQEAGLTHSLGATGSGGGTGGSIRSPYTA